MKRHPWLQLLSRSKKDAELPAGEDDEFGP